MKAYNILFLFYIVITEYDDEEGGYEWYLCWTKDEVSTILHNYIQSLNGWL